MTTFQEISDHMTCHNEWSDEIIIISVHRIYCVDIFAFATCLLHYYFIYICMQMNLRREFRARNGLGSTAHAYPLAMLIDIYAVSACCSDLCAPHKRWQSQFVCCYLLFWDYTGAHRGWKVIKRTKIKSS